MADFGGLSANQINASMGLGPGGVGDQSQAFINSMYGPMGFGGQTAAYAGLGAAYTGATGGNIYGGGNNDPGSAFLSGSRGAPMGSTFDQSFYGAPSSGVLYGGLNPSDWFTFSNAVGADAANAWAAQQGGGGGGIGSDAARAPDQPAIAPQPQSWGDWLSQYQVPAGPQPGEGSMSPAADAARQYLTPAPAPAYDYTSLYQQPSWLSQYQVPAGPQPGEGSMSPAADAIRNYLAPAGGGSDNTYGVDAGTWASMNAGDRATFNRAMGGQGAAPYTGGGIGSDAGQSPGQYQNQDPVVDYNSYFNQLSSRQQAAPSVYPSSPGGGSQTPGGWSQIPTNGPYPNLGYNPGMQNYFGAGGGMQQYNPQQMTNDLQRTLGEIGGGGRSWQALGMSPSDVQTFTNAVGQDAANAWLQKGSQ